MKKFDFKLETVLKMKIRREEQCQKELRAAQELQIEAVRQVEIRKGQIEETVDVYHQSMLGKFDLFVVNDYQDYLQWLTRMLQSNIRRLEECEKQVVFARNRLIEASKEKKMVEKLKERAYHLFRAEALHMEIQFLDELGANRFVRQDING